MRIFLCRAGLHFLVWCLQRNGWVCACGRNHLWAEEIRED